MRISDWSSDVCSSDLQVPERGRADFETRRRISLACKAGEIKSDVGRGSVDDRRTAGDRKSVVEGKSVAVRVDHGGRRIINKKKQQSTENHDKYHTHQCN